MTVTGGFRLIFRNLNAENRCSSPERPRRYLYVTGTAIFSSIQEAQRTFEEISRRYADVIEDAKQESNVGIPLAPAIGEDVAHEHGL